MTTVNGAVIPATATGGVLLVLLLLVLILAGW